jgi:hypothetical protein
MVVGFELRASGFLGKCSTAGAIPPALASFIFHVVHKT